jgi:hypothetical protein
VDEQPARIARLDRATGLHVLCGSALEGRYLCEREFGRIEELGMPEAVRRGEAQLIIDPAPDYELPDGIAMRIFQFPPGWQLRPDGAWDLWGPAPTDAARARAETELETWWSRATGGGRWLPRVIGQPHPTVPELPTRAVCQRCRTVSVLLPEALRVSPRLPDVRLGRIPARR